MKTDIWKDNNTLPDKLFGAIINTDGDTAYFDKVDFDGQPYYQDNLGDTVYFKSWIKQERWCYLDNAIKILSEYQEQSSKIERLTKALDIAKEKSLEIIGYDIVRADFDTIKLLFATIQDIAQDILKEITQALDKKE